MKNKFIKSTIILIIGGLITKVLGMIIKIVQTRTIGTEGISEYMLVLPTLNLFITLCNLGVPIAITKLISEKKNSSKRIVIPTTIIVLLYDFILIFIILKHKKIKSRVLFALFQNPRLNFINHFSIILLFFKLNSFCVHLIKFFCLFLSFLNYELYCPRFYFQPHFFPLSAILTIQCPLDCFF